jgi:hypothetical protein
MNFETPPTLDQLREQFGPWTIEQRVPPSANELATLRAVIPGASIESDRIILPLRGPTGSMGRFTLSIWCFALSSAGAIALTALNATFRPSLPWFLIHTAWVLPVLLFAAHRTRLLQEMIVFPSSPRCQVRRKTLMVESFHHRNLFIATPRNIGHTPHVGHLLLKKARGTFEQKSAAAALLNRYVLFGARNGESEGSDGRPIFPGPFVRWLLEETDCTQLGADRLVFRVLPVGAWFVGPLFGWAWLYFVGPGLVALELVLWPVSHAVMLAIAVSSVGWYVWENRPRMVTLLGGKRAVVITGRNGTQRTDALENARFSPEGEDGSTSLRFMERLQSSRVQYRPYRIAVAASANDEYEEEVEFLARYLDVPVHYPGYVPGPPRSA